MASESDFTIETVPTKPIAGQKPGTSGLRKRVAEFKYVLIPSVSVVVDIIACVHSIYIVNIIIMMIIIVGFLDDRTI